MTNSIEAVTLDTKAISSLSAELGRIARALAKASNHLAQLTRKSVPLAEVSKNTDPEMFTAKFLRTVRKSRQELEQGEFMDYRIFHKTLNSE